MNYRKTPLRPLLSALLAVLAALLLLPPAALAAEGDAISAVALAYGADGAQAMEEAGYTVMGRPLTGDVRLGYQKGGEPVTGLLVSTGGWETVTAGGIDYQRVGSLGSMGDLYLTRDPAAGTALLSLSLQSDEGFVDQPLYALRNDGTVPLRSFDGTPCDLGDGQTAYLFLQRENLFRPYIRSVTAAAGGDLRAAISAAAAAGCEYYYDPGLLTEDGQTAVLGLVRTDNPYDAITCLAAGTEPPLPEGAAFEPAGDALLAGEPSYRLYQSRAPALGNPILGLTGSAVPVRASDVMNKWAEKVFVKFNNSAACVSAVRGEPLYQQFLTDGSPLTHVPVLLPLPGEIAVTPLAYTCRAEGQPAGIFPDPAAPAPEPEAEPPEEPELPPEPEGLPEDPAFFPEPEDSFDPETYLEDVAEVIADGDAPDNTAASVFGDGSNAAVTVALVLAALGAAAGAAAFAARNKKRGREEGPDDEG